ncbi:MAG: protein translocase subunit SecD [Granulosicoccaceae bacterium]
MSNTNPLWKTLLLAAVLLVGAFFALPNIFGSDPAIQISSRSGGLTDSDKAKFTKTLEAAGLSAFEIREPANRIMAVFEDGESQLKAKAVLEGEFSALQYTLAQSLESASPEWLRNIASPMYLGLDLRGGVHFLMEVDMADAIDSAEERFVSDWKRILRAEKKKGSSVQHRNGVLTARMKDAATRDEMLIEFGKEGQLLDMTVRDEGGKFFIDANLTPQAADDEKRTALKQNIVTLRNRINELGVSEPVIQQQGLERIVVQLPGVQDPTRARDILGATATLEYRLVYGNPSDWASAQNGTIPAGTQLFKERDTGAPILLNRDIIVTGDQIKDASSGFDQQSGSPAVFVNLDNAGARRMQDVTAENIGNLMAVVYSEKRVSKRLITDADGVQTEKTETTTIEEVINRANIRDVLSHRFQTTGLASEEASNLALLLRAGALKAPVVIIEERTVGASLGEDNIRQGFYSALGGLALVICFMVFYYKGFGVIAGLALVTNVVLIIAVLSSLQATLTLPGIAGIVLTTGMAVDANVLIFERIREELRAGSGVQTAISAGYDKAFSTIADANVTTLIAAVVLFSLGTGPIKGFAITLSIGILTSMFTAILGSRVLVNALYGGRRLNTLPI